VRILLQVAGQDVQQPADVQDPAGIHVAQGIIPGRRLPVAFDPVHELQDEDLDMGNYVGNIGIYIYLKKGKKPMYLTIIFLPAGNKCYLCWLFW
jgi:hypothetical protein